MKRVLLVLSLLFIFCMHFVTAQAQGNTRSNEIPGIDEIIPIMIPPQTINLAEVTGMIGYPRKARELGIKGTVKVRILVDKEGDYVRHKILSTPHRILSESVNKNIHKIMFTPAIGNDRKPTMYWVNVPVHFELDRRRSR